MSFTKSDAASRSAAAMAAHFTSSSSQEILISSPTAKLRQELTQFFTSGSSR
jgi:hypothetical protein